MHCHDLKISVSLNSVFDPGQFWRLSCLWTSLFAILIHSKCQTRPRIQGFTRSKL